MSEVETTKQKKVEPKIMWKDKRSFRHDLFKLLPAEMKKNISWRKNDPIIESISHSHIYHSHTSEGTPQESCSPVGGHFHKMTVTVTSTGDLKATCGPPLRITEKLLNSGSVRKLEEPVQWFNEKINQMVIDNHVHEVAYIDSEEISADKIKSTHRSDAERLALINKGGK